MTTFSVIPLDSLTGASGDQILALLKGGPGSGNFGHGGRPGEVGGSAPKGASAPKGKGAGMFTITGAKGQLAEFNLTQDDLRSVTEMPGCDTWIKVYHLPAGQIGGTDRLSIEGRWTDSKTGKVAGEFQRVLLSNKIVVLSLLELKPTLINTGHGTEFARNWLNLMASSGYIKAELDAALTIGRYAWAKEGAQYKSPKWAERATRNFKQWLSEKNISGIDQPPFFQTPQDVANYKHPGGVELSGSQISNEAVSKDMKLPLGKAFMLDFNGHGEWEGVFDLTKLKSYQSRKAITVTTYKAKEDTQELIPIEGGKGSDAAFWAAYLTEDEAGTPMLFDDAGDVTKGGPGSGNFGHSGRPGEVGGSAPKGKRVGGKVKVASLSDQLDATDSRLYQDSRIIHMPGFGNVAIGKAVTYANKDGNGSFSVENKVTIGPAEWVGKSADEIPELMAEIDRQIDNIEQGQGGDFSKQKYTDDQSIISKILYGYKSPLTTEATGSPIQILAKAYYDNGATAITIEGLPIRRLQERQKMYREQRAVFEEKFGKDNPGMAFFDDYARNMAGEELTEKLRSLELANYRKLEISQEAVNQFASEVRRTQDDLRSRHGDSITLYRGITGEYANALKAAVKSAGTVDLETHDISSWSEYKSVADKFADGGVVIQKTIPVKDILFSHYTSPYIRMQDWPFGGEDEGEFIVGHPGRKLRVSKNELI